MKNELGGHKEAEAYWNEAELHIQARYCNILGRSLSTKIKIERVEEINYLDVSINKDFSLYNPAVDRRAYDVIGSADLVVFMSGEGSGDQGYAFQNSACQTTWGYKRSLSRIQPKSAAGFAMVSPILYK